MAPPKNAPQNSAAELCKYDVGGNYWTLDSKGKGVLQFAEKGLASEKKCPHKTIPQVFESALKKFRNKVVLRTENELAWKKGEDIPAAKPLSEWKSWTFDEFHKDVRSMAKAVIASGMEPADTVNIFGFNSPEWVISTFGAIYAGGKAAGIYGSDNKEQVQYKVHHSNGAIAVAESAEHYEKYKSNADELPYLKAIVCWAMDPGEDVTRSDGSVIKTYTWDSFLKMGSEQADDELEKRLGNIEPNDACSIIYTSGTTGNPKAVMISHDNILFESLSVTLGCVKVLGTKKEEERVLSYLPLSHVAGMMIDAIVPIVIAEYTKGWCSVNFARPYDLKAGSIGERLKAVQPTIFFGVPRVWEKIMEKLLAVGASMPDGFKKNLAKNAKAASLKAQQNQQLGGSGKKPKMLAIYNILLKKIKAKLGLDKAKFFFAGAAPMTPVCLSYFGSIGINVNEVYGMSECTGACTFSNDKVHTWGSIGFEIPGVEVKIFRVAEDGSKTECPAAVDLFSATEEEQGEICFRGRNNMMGYMANEKFGEEHVKQIEKKNMEAIDAEGWLHSGDKGCKDSHGIVKITGRYKELIIGAGGENIAPVPIEDEMKRVCPAISNIVMIGDKRKFNVCLISLKAFGASGEVPGTDELDGAARTVNNSSASTITEARADAGYIKVIEDALTEVNANKKVIVNNSFKIQKFTILERDFSVETGELTATLKLKRSVVDKMYSDIIEKMYASSDVYVPV